MGFHDELERLRNEKTDGAETGGTEDKAAAVENKAEAEGDEAAATGAGKEQEAAATDDKGKQAEAEGDTAKKDVKDKSAKGKKDKPAAAEEEKQPTNEDWAKTRRDLAAANKRAEEAEARATAVNKPKEEAKQATKADADAEPNKAENPQEWQDWRIRQLEKQVNGISEKHQKEEQTREQKDLVGRAISEFEEIEGAFKSKVSDYEDVSKHVIQTLAGSIRALNPGIGQRALGDAVQNHLLGLASKASRAGYNPAEYIYHYGKESLGYTPAEPAAQEDDAADDKKNTGPNLKAIDKNRQRSASGAAAGGKGANAEPSLESVGPMKFSDFSKLSPAQRQTIKNQSRRRA